jgi:putative membrane protein
MCGEPDGRSTMMYGWYNQGMGGGWWVLMMIGMVVFWAIFVIGIVYLVRHHVPRMGDAHSTSSTTSAMGILKERFAQGELTEEEYTRRRKLLEEDS